MFTYTEEKKFTKEQVQQLFLSVGWISGKYPERLYKALMNSSTVLTVWDDEKLVGLTRVLDDTEMLAQIHYVLVDPAYQGKGIAGKQALAGVGVTAPVVLAISAFAALVSMGGAPKAIFLTIWRKIIILIPLIFLLPHFIPDAAMGVYLAEPIADTIAVCTTGPMFYVYYRKLK